MALKKKDLELWFTFFKQTTCKYWENYHAVKCGMENERKKTGRRMKIRILISKNCTLSGFAEWPLK